MSLFNCCLNFFPKFDFSSIWRQSEGANRVSISKRKKTSIKFIYQYHHLKSCDLKSYSGDKFFLVWLLRNSRSLILPCSLKDGDKHTHSLTHTLHTQIDPHIQRSVYQSALCATHPSFILMVTGDTGQKWIPVARNLVIQANCKMNLNLVFILIFQTILFLHEVSKETHLLKVYQKTEKYSGQWEFLQFCDTWEIELMSLAAMKEKFILTWKPNDNKEHSTGTFLTWSWVALNWGQGRIWSSTFFLFWFVRLHLEKTSSC